MSDVCKKHAQEPNHSHFAEHNCDLCKALAASAVVKIQKVQVALTFSYNVKYTYNVFVGKPDRLVRVLHNVNQQQAERIAADLARSFGCTVTRTAIEFRPSPERPDE